MSTTNSTIVHEWDDDPEPGCNADDWPYPNHYAKSLITGELADRINARLGQDANTPVFITERTESGGYSEYTQETDYYHVIDAGTETVEIGPHWDSNGIRKLTEWLDK